MTKRIIGQIVKGKFVKGKPKEINNREHPLHRQFVRDSMREEYARDIEQRYKHGQVNQGYIEAFGKDNAIKEGLVEEPNYE